MAGQSFDFNSYLENFTGIRGWHVEELYGGAANFTVRAQRRHSQNLSSDSGDQNQEDLEVFKTNTTMIIKQAPPYLAKSPEIPFSPYRQTIEATALQLFRFAVGDPNSLQNVLICNPWVRIPELLLRDQASAIMVQSDLGSHPNLYDVLTSPETHLPAASELGRVIGHFLADMHSSAVVSPTVVETFHNEDAEGVMEVIITQATRYLQDAGVDDAQLLGNMAMHHWRTREKTVFSQGDLWFGTLLVDLKPRNGNNKNPPVVGICDWEFAGPNDPAADLAQLGCYLHLLSISPLTTPSVNEVILALAEALYSSYYVSLKTPPNAHFLKSLLIMHGWEMVNAAGWNSRQNMWCVCQGQGVKCIHIKALVKEAAKFLRAANDLEIQSLNEIYWSRFLPRGAC